ncbi:DUF5131 family protein [Candidatus Pacearchaeota archaeon]|nr:DUF5131 family protein [Candidatus Pacearchaeota archaeon]
MPTKIEYLDETINPIQDTRKGKSGRGYHCTKCSPGCQHCWAEAYNMRFGNRQPFDDTPVQFEIIESELTKLRQWKKHRYIGVQFMGDLYHPDVHEWMNSYIYNELYKNPQHTYLLLTKREKLMQTFFLGRNIPPHIHGGLTVCNQQEADKKIPIFLQIPFAAHVLSIEPMLGPIILQKPWQLTDEGKDYLKSPGKRCLRGVIVGGESGRRARPMHPDWVRSVRDQCQEAGVPFFFKQWGEWLPGEASSLTGYAYQDSAETIAKRGKEYIWKDNSNRATAVISSKVGKKEAGRLLDGREWNERPEQ